MREYGKNKFYEKYFDNYSKKNMTIYFVLRVLVILTLLRQIFLMNWNNVFLCGLTLFLFVVPAIIEKKDNCILVKLDNSIKGVTSGQSAVFYIDDVVIGGGIIK